MNTKRQGGVKTMKQDDEQSIPFAIVPAEVVMDTRLTLETMRVLVTLFSFRNKTTGLTFPSREAISERCGTHPSNISEATRKLVEMGWIEKDGKGGYSKATKYTITIPKEIAKLSDLHRAKSQARTGSNKTIKVAEQATVVQSATVAEQAIQIVAQSATHEVAQSATRKRTDQLTNKGTDNIASALLLEVNRQVAADFLAIRKAKKSPLTETAINGIKREADKAGYTLEQALTVCCERGWAGFKAEWILRDQANGKLSITKDQEKREATERAYARLFGKNEKEVIHETTGL